MEVKVAKTAGFCFGVKRAVEKAYEVAEKEQKDVYTYGPIIHNEEVVNDLAQKGVHVIETEEDLKKLQNGIVVIRSHGVPKKIYSLLEEKEIEYVDVTCPFVLKIHRIVERESKAGRHIVIIGNEAHPEVEGIRGWCEGESTVIKTKEQAEKFLESPPEKVCIVSQTTFNYKNFQELVEIINKKTRNGYIECEIYVDIDEDREILDYYISFEIKDDGRIYITEERLSRKNGNYSKNSYFSPF